MTRVADMKFIFCGDLGMLLDNSELNINISPVDSQIFRSPGDSSNQFYFKQSRNEGLSILPK